ncbi:MAG: hypothetical protein QXL75_01315 [archaeon]
MDFLDSKGVPIYSIIDPLEKKGIPSLPVFAGIFVAILVGIYLMLAGGGGGAPTPKEIQFSIFVKDNITKIGISGASITLKDLNGKTVYSGETVDGIVELSAEPGEYSIQVEKTGCLNYESTITVESDTYQIPIYLKCQGELSRTSVQLCFETADFSELSISSIKYSAYDGERVVKEKDVLSCEENATCVMSNFVINYSYKFETLNYETDLLPGEYIKNKIDSGVCIKLDRKEIKEEYVKVKVKVVDENNNPLAGVTVKLVNPLTNYTYSSETTGYSQGYLGIANLKVPKNANFSVKVEAGENNTNYDSYIDENKTWVANITGGTLEILIQVNTTSPTYIYTFKQTQSGEVPVGGAYITVFKGNDIISKAESDETGVAKIALKKRETYRASVFLQGYNYTEFEIVGGESKKIYLTELTSGEYGDIKVTVIFKGTEIPVKDAEVKLFSKDESQLLGIPSIPEKTGVDGKVMFNGVPIGEYCVKAIRFNDSSSCVQVTVKGGSLVRKVIEIERKKYTIGITVLEKESEEVLSNAEVVLFDKRVGEEQELVQLTSGKTSIDGYVEFEVPEYSNIIVKGTWRNTSTGKIYGGIIDVGMLTKDVSIDLKLAFVNFTVYFDRATNGNVEESLSVGEQYVLHFLVSLPDLNNEPVDKAEFSIKERSGCLEFGRVEPTDFTQSTEVSGVTYVISGYPDEYRNTTLEVRVPIRVKTTCFNDNVTLEYSATWYKGDAKVSDPKKGTKKIFFYISRESNLEPGLEDKTIMVKAEVNYKGNSYSPNAVEIKENEPKYNLTISFINEGSTRSSSEISITSNTLSGITTEFLTTMVLREFNNTLTTIDESEYEANETDVKLSLKDWRTGEKIIVKIEAEAKIPPQVIIHSFVDNNKVAETKINYSAQASIRIEIEPEKITDLTTNFSIKVYKEGLNTPINPKQYHVEGKITMDGRTIQIKSSEYSNNYKYKRDRIEIYFDDQVRAYPGTKIEINLSGDNLKEGQIKKVASPCLEIPTTKSINLDVSTRETHSCLISVSKVMTKEASFEAPRDNNCTESNPVSLTLKKCDPDVEVDITKVVVEGTGGASPSGYISSFSQYTQGAEIKYSFGKTLEAGASEINNINITINASKEFKSNKKISSAYTIRLTIMAKAPSVEEISEGYFKPLKIQKYGLPLDCETNFCSLDQILAFIIEKTDNFSSPNPVTFKSVALKGATPQDIQRIFTEIYSKAEFVIISEMASQSSCSYCTSGKEKCVLINNGAGIEGAGEYQLKINKITDSCVEINSFDSTGRLSGLEIVDENENDVRGVQAFWPVLNESLSSSTTPAIYVHVYFEGIGGSEKDGILQKLGKALKAQWNTDVTLKEITQKNEIELGPTIIVKICNESAIINEGEDKKAPCHLVSDKLGRYEANIIFRKGWNTYIIGKNKGELEELISNLEKTLRGTLSLKYIDEDSIGENYLTLTSSTIQGICVQGNGECSRDVKEKLNNNIINLIAKIEKVSPAEVNFLWKSGTTPPDNIKSVFVAICTSISTCEQNAQTIFKNKWGSTADIPKSGIIWSDSQGYKIFAKDSGELETLISNFKD